MAELQRKADEAQREESGARALAARSQADLEDLSSAYNNLEIHSFKLEQDLRTLQHSSPPAGMPASDLPLPYGYVNSRGWIVGALISVAGLHHKYQSGQGTAAHEFIESYLSRCSSDRKVGEMVQCSISSGPAAKVLEYQCA